MPRIFWPLDRPGSGPRVTVRFISQMEPRPAIRDFFLREEHCLWSFTPSTLSLEHFSLEELRDICKAQGLSTDGCRTALELQLAQHGGEDEEDLWLRLQAQLASGRGACKCTWSWE